MNRIKIQEGTIENILTVYPAIPEFTDPPDQAAYERRLFHAPKHLILIAFDGNLPVGFKAGYERETDGSFYSWMGGVLPAYRQHHVAKQLANVQEAWAKENDYHTIKFKTRNRHKAMLLFALKNGFQIITVEPKENIAEYRISLQKDL